MIEAADVDRAEANISWTSSPSVVEMNAFSEEIYSGVTRSFVDS